ncbi:MAG: AAA family ATPase [Bacteroidota bacterium]
MSKPNPYYSNEKEREELNRMSLSFAFNEIEEHPKTVILIAGKEGSGKTHLACTMSEKGPVYLIDTEYRAQIVTRKFKNVKFATVKNYKELVVAVKHILTTQPPGTIVIDSISDLQTFAEIEYLDRTKKEAVYPIFNWGDVYALCNAIIDDIKFSGKFNLVLTARVKEEYIGDKPTGKMLPRVYLSVPYKSDIVLQFSNDSKSLSLNKNGYTGNLDVPIKKGQSLPSILDVVNNCVILPQEIAPPTNIISSQQPVRKVTTLRKVV